MLNKKRNIKKNKKGIIFSIDAILSIIATITLISASFFYLSQIQVVQWSQPNYFLNAIDTLNVLRIDGTLQNAIDTNNYDKIQEFMNKTYGNNICGSMEIFSKDETVPITQINKTGCNNYEDVYIFRNTIVEKRNIYKIALKLWYQ